MAKLVAVSYTWESTVTLVNTKNCFCWLQVVLSEDHDFCCNKQEAMCLNDVRSGNKAVSICGQRITLGSNAMNAMRTVPWPWVGILQIRNELPPKKGAVFVGQPSILVLIASQARWESSYLVDPASSHMLVSKIKPCMSKYKQVCTVKLRMAH